MATTEAARAPEDQLLLHVPALHGLEQLTHMAEVTAVLLGRGAVAKDTDVKGRTAFNVAAMACDVEVTLQSTSNSSRSKHVSNELLSKGTKRPKGVTTTKLARTEGQEIAERLQENVNSAYSSSS